MPPKVVRLLKTNHTPEQERDMSSVSEAHIRQAWLGLLDSERLTRYYSYLAARFQQRHRWITLGVTAGSVATAILSWAPSNVASTIFDSKSVSVSDAGLVSIAVAGAAIWLLLADYSRRSLHASTLESDCNEVVLQWKMLWSEMANLDDQLAAKRIRDLELSGSRVTKHVSSRLPLLSRLNKRCAHEVYKEIQNEQRQQSRP